MTSPKFLKQYGCTAVVFPNPDIEPKELYLGYKLSIKPLLKKIKFEFSPYYTWFRNALVKAPFTINGQILFIYNGVKCQVLATQNSNKAFCSRF
jgi:hemoglobin/transferrin/lactoferrin receptor protein